MNSPSSSGSIIMNGCLCSTSSSGNGLDTNGTAMDDDEDGHLDSFRIIQPCCQQGISNSTQHSLLRSSPVPSLVNSTLDEVFTCEAVLITDGNADSQNTVAVLRYCRRRILKPRDVMLSLLGYRDWVKEDSGWCKSTKVLNMLYFVIFFMFISIGPVLQYNICLRRDLGIKDGVSVYNNRSYLSDTHHTDKCTGSILFVYVIPDIMYICAYLMTCLVLRFGDSEQLQTLLERVYLIASCSPWELVKHRQLGCISVVWLIIGLFCLVLSLTSMILHIITAKYIPCSVLVPCNDSLRIILSCITVCSLWMGDITIVMGILLYCSQCHLLYMLLCIIKSTLLHAAASLLAIKKQIDESTRFVQHLNRELGLIVGLFLCLTVFRAITGIVNLVYTVKSYNFYLLWSTHSEKDLTIPWLHISAMSANAVCWLMLSALPFVMASKVSSGFRILNKTGSTLHARPFGYQATPQQDIDSFLLYVSSLRLSAKILWIPIRTPVLVSLLVLLLMSIVVIGYLYL